MRSMIAAARPDMKVSVLIETQGPLLDIAAEKIPENNGVRNRQRLLAQAQQLFRTHVLESRLNRLAYGTRSHEDGHRIQCYAPKGST